MAKNKQQKKKERERRVAQKKLAAQKRQREKSAEESETAAAKPKRVFTAQPQPKIQKVAANNKKSTFTQRRIGGS